MLHFDELRMKFRDYSLDRCGFWVVVSTGFQQVGERSIWSSTSHKFGVNLATQYADDLKGRLRQSQFFSRRPVCCLCIRSIVGFTLAGGVGLYGIRTQRLGLRMALLAGYPDD